MDPSCGPLLHCPGNGSTASLLHAPFPTWKTPFSPTSPALPLLTDSTKLNCTKHTLENLINIVWKYNWGLTGAWIFHFEAKISPLIYEKDLVLQTTMTVKINVNLSYAFPHNLQSLFSKVLYVTTAHITRQSCKHLKILPSPALFRFSTGCRRAQKHLTRLGFKIPRKVSELHVKTEACFTLGSGFVSTWLLAHQLIASPWIFKSKVFTKVVSWYKNTHLTWQLFCSQPVQHFYKLVKRNQIKLAII